MQNPKVINRFKNICLILFISNLFYLFAEEEKKPEYTMSLDIQGAYYFGNQNGYGQTGGFAPLSYTVIPNNPIYRDVSDPGRDLGTSWGGIEAKAIFNYNIKIPFLAFDNPLLNDNNLTCHFAGEFTPISVNAVTDVTLTPVAFLKFSAGGKLGTGWSCLGLNGLALNLSDITYTSPQPVTGLVYRVWLSGTFQFDLGAVIQGEWTHLVMLANPKFEYQAFTGADANTAWQFEADRSENFNGWKYWGTYFVGYQMPLLIDTVGIMLETEQYIGSVSEKSPKSAIGGGWGSDFVFMRFGPLFNFKFSKNSSLALLLQFKAERDYTDETIGNRYFGLRKYESTYIFFERLAFNYSQTF